MTRAVVLFGHGSRDPQWREAMDAVAQRMRARAADAEVRCAFLELQTPGLTEAVSELAEAGARTIRVVPFFLGVGRHVREDLPRLVGECRKQHPGLSLELLPSVGENPRVLDLLATLSLE